MEAILRPTDNNFEPGQNVQFDKNYNNEQSYLYQREEKDLQDQLFKMYEEITDEEEYGDENDD